MAMTVRSAARRTPAPQVFTFGPESAGTRMTPAEFDRGDFQEGWRYELIHDVLIVSPSPRLKQRISNQFLGHRLLSYQEAHPMGAALSFTVGEQTIKTGHQRRCVDRVIWTGLGRLPRRGEAPQIVVEFVPNGRRGRWSDYELKQVLFAAVQVQEYWVFDCFSKTLTVLLQGGRMRKRVLNGSQLLTTPLLPGFVLPLAKLFALANRWPDNDDAEA